MNLSSPLGAAVHGMLQQAISLERARCEKEFSEKLRPLTPEILSVIRQRQQLAIALAQVAQFFDVSEPDLVGKTAAQIHLLLDQSIAELIERG